MQVFNNAKWTCLTYIVGILFMANAIASPLLINGAGATFPFPIYSKWFSEYQKVAADVQINYQSIGSGGGIRQFLDGTIDFGASDAPMTDEQLAKSPSPILHIPTVMGAVVLTYNLPEVKQPLKLSGELIADIFLGKVTSWADPAIAKLNPGVKFPANLPVMVVHRADGSGTTAVFADYLAKVSPDWKTKVGTGTALNWPAGLGGRGNEGVTGLIKQTVGAIGYVELIYAESNHMPTASLKNAAGAFVTASPASVTAAATASLATMPKDFRVSITNAANKAAYPISAFTYLLVHRTMPAPKGMKIKNFLQWAVTEGQKFAPDMAYAPLPKPLVAKVKASIAEISESAGK